MNNQNKVKAFLGLATFIVISLLFVVGFQLFNIIKTKNTIANQNKTIEELQQQLDYYQNKNNGDSYEEIV